MNASRIDELADDIRNAFGHTPGCECAACTELLGLLNTYLAPEGDWEGLSGDEKNAFYLRVLNIVNLKEWDQLHKPEDEAVMPASVGDIVVNPGEVYTSAWMKFSDPRSE